MGILGIRVTKLHNDGLRPAHKVRISLSLYIPMKLDELYAFEGLAVVYGFKSGC